MFEELRTDPGRISGNGVQSLSWELWSEKNELVAADIGLRMGAVYSSLTGFSDRQHPSIGIVQLATEALLLKKLGFKTWDLGMEIPYKLDLGAKKISGREYRAIFNENNFESIEGCISRTSLSKLSDFVQVEKELMNPSRE